MQKGSALSSSHLLVVIVEHSGPLVHEDEIKLEHLVRQVNVNEVPVLSVIHLPPGHTSGISQSPSRPAHDTCVE